MLLVEVVKHLELAKFFNKQANDLGRINEQT